MGKSVLFVGGGGITPSEGSFVTIGSRGAGLVVTTEAYSQFKFKYAGILSKLWAGQSNTGGATVTSTLRLNGADTPITISHTTNNVQEDTTHTQAVAIDDLVDVKWSGVAFTPSIPRMRAVFEASGVHTAIFAADDAFTPSASTTNFTGLSSGETNSTTEANVKQRIRTAGTFSQGQCYLSANGAASASTLQTRKNAANGNIVMTLTAGAPGYYADTTHSDTVADGDDYCWSLITGSGGTITLNMHGLHFQNSTDRQNDIFTSAAGAGVTRAASGTIEYYAPVGRALSNVSESVRKVRFGFPSVVSKMRIFVSANTYAAAGTMVSSKNAAAGGQTLSIVAGAPGFYEDTTGSDTLGASDDFTFSIIGGTSGSITIRWAGFTQRDTSVVNGTLSATLANFTLAATGTNKLQAATAATIDAFTLASTGTVRLASVVGVTLDNFTTTSAAALHIGGTSSGIVGPFTLAATSTLAVRAAVGVTLDNFTLNAHGGLPQINGALDLTIDPFLGTETGALKIAGTLSATVGAFTLLASAQLLEKATLGVTFGNFTLSSSAQNVNHGVVGATVGAFSTTSAAALHIGGTSAGLIGPFTLSSVGKIVAHGALGVTLPNFTLVATGHLPRTGILAEAFGNFTLLSVGRHRVPQGQMMMSGF